MLQQNPLNEFVLVEFPGIVKNLDRAIEMLGGTQSISLAHSLSLPLRLKFKPQNEYHPPLVAQKKNMTSLFSGQIHLVVKVKQMRDADTSLGISLECLGIVSTVYSFTAISDFQYLPIQQKSSNANLYEDLVPRLIPTDFGSAFNWWDRSLKSDQAPPSFLPPYTFSRFNTPSKNILHNEIDRFIKRPVIGHGKNLRSERRAQTICVNGADPFPEKPTDEAIKDSETRCKNPTYHKIITELFAQRPLWNKIALSYKTQLGDNVLKVILSKYAFYIASGPWGRLWCRFGYDPRQDPGARQYQSISISFKKNHHIPQRKRLKLVQTGVQSGRTVNPSKGQFYEYIFRTGCLPSLRQMWYCVCDINLPVAQKVTKKDFFEVLKKFDENYGWIPGERIEAIRDAVKQDVRQAAKKMGLDDKDDDEEIEFQEMADGTPGEDNEDEFESDGDFDVDPDFY